jgi:hypothetical protein
LAQTTPGKNSEKNYHMLFLNRGIKYNLTQRQHFLDVLSMENLKILATGIHKTNFAEKL